MVFLVLAVTWAVVLTFWFRARSQPSLSDSVTQFHRHLRVIERAAPATMAAANRLHGPVAVTLPLGPMLSTAVAGDRLTGHEGPDTDWAEPLPPTGRSGGRDRDQAAAERRRRVQRRRRDVLIVLAALAVATLVLTLVDRIPDAAVAQIVTDVALGGYILLLARARTAAARRSARRRRHSVRPLRRLHVSRRSQRAPGAEMPSVEVGSDLYPAGDWDGPDDSDDTAGFDAAALRRAVSH